VLAADETWVESFGTPVLTFLEATAFGDRVERRVLYETGEDVDFPLLEASGWRELSASPEARAMLARGHRVLYDELGLQAVLEGIAPVADPWPPDAQAFKELASDFWYHALWCARKLRRGEVFTAIQGLDGYLKARLVTLLEWHARALDPAADTWHGGRFLERWADPGALAALERAYAHYDLRDVARALWETMDLWQGVEEETARRLGLETKLDHADLRRRIAEIVPDVRSGRML
jgi:aminoglycoside 6-adenylyltransferase